MRTGVPRPRSVTAARAEVALPEPEIERAELGPLTPDLTAVRPVPPMVAVLGGASVETAGPGVGAGVGPGGGSGTGGGIGTGQGSGIGSGTGPGVGGESAVYAPEPRAIVFPFEQPPASVRGRRFRIRFWVDAHGRVVDVEIVPRIEDQAFRRTLLERVSSWTFYPARTVEGKPVAGQFVITYAP